MAQAAGFSIIYANSKKLKKRPTLSLFFVPLRRFFEHFFKNQKKLFKNQQNTKTKIKNYEKEVFILILASVAWSSRSVGAISVLFLFKHQPHLWVK